MNVALLTTSFPDTNTGQEAAGAFVFDYTLQLSRHGKVYVLCPGKKREVIHREAFTEYRYWSPSIPLSQLKLVNPIHLACMIRVILSGFMAAKTLATQHRDLDLVLALWALPSGLWGLYLKKRCKAVLATWSLGSDIWSLGKIPLVKNILSHILKSADANYADGLLLQKDVEALSNKTCEFLPSTRNINFDDIPRQPGNKPWKVGFLGRWHPNKGPDIFLQAIKQLDVSCHNAIESIQFAGGGPMEKEIKAMITGMKHLPFNIELHSWLDQQAAHQYLQSLDILVIPSRIESIPVIFSDAIKNNCVIVSTPIGDMPDLIDKYQCGACSDEVTAESLALALENILLQSSLIPYLDQRDRIVADFSLENSVSRLLESLQGANHSE
jgi:glycosyltransferase involved in cell wall biosynthesis